MSACWKGQGPPAQHRQVGKKENQGKESMLLQAASKMHKEEPLQCSFLEADQHHSIASCSERPAWSNGMQRVSPPPEKGEAVGFHSKLPKAENNNKTTVSQESYRGFLRRK